jgi:hypothetical protein
MPVEFRRLIMEPCRILDSQVGGYEKFCLVGHSALQLEER